MPETKLSAAEIISAFQNNHYSIAERIGMLRAFRDSIPGLVPIDPRLEGRIRAARAMKKEKIDTTINALEDSEMWQQAAAVTPKDIRLHRDQEEELQLLAEEARMVLTVVTDNAGYQHLLGAEKCRIVINAGRGISGDAALTVKPRLERIAEFGPARRKRESAAPETVKKQ